MKTPIIYRSRTGITKKFAEAIGHYLAENNHTSTIHSIEDHTKAAIKEADLIFLGCWTHGLMIMMQHPDKTWKTIIPEVEGLEGKKVVLFTTYKLATGSMFKKMEKVLANKNVEVIGTLKSKNGNLNKKLKNELQLLIN
jgi:flavodoxin